VNIVEWSIKTPSSAGEKFLNHKNKEKESFPIPIENAQNQKSSVDNL
jgi:hypothetical protein